MLEFSGADPPIAAPTARGAFSFSGRPGERIARVRAIEKSKVEVSPETALRLAGEHVVNATKAVSGLPDRSEDGSGHARGMLALHAHVIAAHQYLDHYRNSVDLCGLLGSDGDDVTVAESDDPEACSIRQSNRAHAAAILLASGDAASARKVLRTSTPRKPR